MRHDVGRAVTLVPAVTLVSLGLLTACGFSAGDGHHCTLIGAPSGIGVEVPPELANRVADATLTACWDDTCQTRTLDLSKTPLGKSATPGNPVMTTESAAAAEGPAASTHRAAGSAGRPGFVNIGDLPGKPVDVTLVFEDQRGATLLDRRTRMTPQLTHPNGRGCSPGGHQAHLTITEAGSLVPD